MSAGLDDRLDTQLQARSAPNATDADRAGEPLGSYVRVAGEVQRVLAEESPHLSARTQAQHLNMLRAYARQAPRRRFALPFVLQIPRWAQAALAALAILILASGASTASANSLPGSPLYPVKRLVEQGQLVLAPDAAARARVWMELAQRRLDEAQALAASQGQLNTASLDAIEASLDQALREIEAANTTDKSALQQEARQVIRHQTTVLESLAANATPDERSRVQQTLNTLANLARTAGEPEPSPSPAPTWTATPETTPTPAVTGTPTPRPSPTPPPTSTTAPPTAVLTVPVSPTPEPSAPAPEPTGQFQAGTSGPDKHESPEPADSGSGSDDNKGPGNDNQGSDNKGSGSDDQDSDNKGSDDDKSDDQDKDSDDEDKGNDDQGGNDGKGGNDDRGKK